MDYLDPAKQLRHRALLFTGYILVGVAVVIATVILLNQAYGFGIGKNGQVIQNGLIFFSSQPSPASIYIDGKLKGTTNTQLYLPEGVYKVSLARKGYDDWRRTIEIDGGSVEHFDYPFLIPSSLTTNKPLGTYAAAPQLVTQSPDRRWLVVSKPGSPSDFDIYDLKNPAKAPVVASLPANIVTKSAASDNWLLSEWADDNQHVVLEHDYDGKVEFVLLDRANPSQSVNLNASIGANPSKLTLVNKKYDQYYLYDAAAKLLQSATLGSQTKNNVLDNVLAYQSYGNDTLLYVTNKGAKPNQVLLRMQTGGTQYTLHSLPASPSYVLDLTEYNGTMYVAAGASASNKVYIYKDPVGQLANDPGQAVTPIQVLHVVQPNYVSFSDTAQFIVAENGTQFGVYDIENQKGYTYSAAAPAAPQAHATWMDGDRLAYVSGGKLLIFDYDHTNQHVLVSDSSQYEPVFAPDYKYVYSVAANSAGQFDLNQTWLLAPADR